MKNNGRLHLQRRIGAMLMLAAVISCLPARSRAQETVIHDFTGPDGARPTGDLIFDSDGNIYGVTDNGGYITKSGDCVSGCGTVFKLSRVPGGWKHTILYKFHGGTDGSNPMAGLVIDGAGNLYGTAVASASESGVVFELSPRPSGGRQFSVIHAFTGMFGQGPDGGHPQAKLLLDSAGNLYGTASSGGTGKLSSGVVFELSQTSPGNWTETVLHNFTGGSDGGQPESGLIFDASGNLYGATLAGGDLSKCPGNGCGVVFELSPNSGVWTETVLHTFQGLDGNLPFGNLIFDAAGNLYGAANEGGNASGCCGVIYELSPSASGWTETVLHTFNPGNHFNGGYKGAFPFDLAMDAKGDLYSATFAGGRAGAYAGVVFKLSHTSTGWAETVLHAFYGGLDGGGPESGVTFDKEGNLYGVTATGGTGGILSGVVYEVIPVK